MDKFLLFENINLLKYRIEKIIKDMGTGFVESYSSHLLTFSSLNKILEDAKLLMIDLDNFTDSISSLLSQIRNVKEYDTLPILLLSAPPKQSILEEIASYDNLELLIKPFSDIELLERLLKVHESPRLETVQDAFLKEPSSHLETNLLVWNTKFEIGIPEVDKEHQAILEQFAILYSLMVEGKGHLFYPKFLTFLKEYVEIHFSHEEALQKKINYPYYKKHALAHVQFKNQVLELLEQQSHKEITNKDLILLNLFVKKWLIHHILVEDKKIKQFLSPNK